MLEACAVLGRDLVVDWCADLLTERIDSVRAVEDDSLPSLAWLGWRSVPPDAGELTAGEAAWTPADPVNAYWVRVWAARAFLYVWREDVVEVLIQAAGQCGLDAALVRRRLAGDEDEERVERDANAAKDAGIDGVPCFIFGDRVAVQGAQAPEHLAQAIQRAADDYAKGEAAE